MSTSAKTKGSTLVSEDFFVHADVVSLRVKGINRLKLPGSFKVHLLKNGKVIATKAFYQSEDAEQRVNSTEEAIVHFDFELPLDALSEGKMEIWVEPLDHSLFGDRFPSKLMGDPTVNVRLLVSNN